MSSTWSNKMRAMYLLSFLLLFSLALSPLVYKKLNKPPTCYDGIRNQNETAIDMGGPCKYLNPADLKPLIVHWARSFEVVAGKDGKSGLYSAVSYVENPNPYAGIRKAVYTFKLYDERGVYITEKSGKTFIPPGKVVPIFQNNFEVGLRVPVYARFSIDKELLWERMQDESAAEIRVSREVLKEVSNQPQLSAYIHNEGVYTIRDLVIVSTLFDRVGNAIGASRTLIDTLPPDSAKEVVFTWPQSFNEPVVKIDVIPLLPPVDSLQ